MNPPPQKTSCPRVLILSIGLLMIVVAAWWFFSEQGNAARGDVLEKALQTVIAKKNPNQDQLISDQALAAQAIIENYHEIQKNTSRWSGVHWGFIILSAVLSALAGLTLKLESFLKNDAIKKDIAAAFAILASLLITISSSGEFQKKWQANLVAAAELERVGYDFLEKNGANPRSYMATIGRILEARRMATISSSEQKKDSSGV